MADTSAVTTRSYAAQLRVMWPIHLAVGVAVIALSYYFYPSVGHVNLITLHKVIHLGAFATHFGTQFWVSFIAGVTMIRTLRRHDFGAVQSKLFPRYFTLGLITSVIQLMTYLHMFDHFTTEEWIQVAVMGAAIVVIVINRFILVPGNLRNMDRMYSIEKEAGVGNEVGYKTYPELQKNETYAKTRKNFLYWHGLSSVANLVSFCVNLFHLYNLGSKL